MIGEILSREVIARQADKAAQRSAATGRVEANPHAAGTEAAAVWDAAFRRYLHLHESADGTEGGA